MKKLADVLTESGRLISLTKLLGAEIVDVLGAMVEWNGEPGEVPVFRVEEIVLRSGQALEIDDRYEAAYIELYGNSTPADFSNEDIYGLFQEQLENY